MQKQRVEGVNQGLGMGGDHGATKAIKFHINKMNAFKITPQYSMVTIIIMNYIFKNTESRSQVFSQQK